MCTASLYEFINYISLSNGSTTFIASAFTFVHVFCSRRGSGNNHLDDCTVVLYQIRITYVIVTEYLFDKKKIDIYFEKIKL